MEEITLSDTQRLVIQPGETLSPSGADPLVIQYDSYVALEIPNVLTFSVFQNGESLLHVVASWNTSAEFVLIDWGDGTTTEYFSGTTAGHDYERYGTYAVALTAISPGGETTEQRSITLQASQITGGTVFSRFTDFAVLPTTRANGAMI